MILRRGPSRWSRGYLWNFATDEVAPGDWIQAKVDTGRCVLSTDGRYLCARYFDFGPVDPSLEGRYGSRISLSLAPSYAPVAQWIAPSAHGEPGRWQGPDGEIFDFSDATGWIYRRDLVAVGWELIHPMTSEIPNVHDEAHRRELLKVGSPLYDGSPESMRVLQEWYFARMTDPIPLRIYEEAEEMVRAFDRGTIVRLRTRASMRCEVRDHAGRVRLELRPKEYQPQWIDLDPRGRLVYGDRGCLWAWEGFPKGKPKLIADLNGDRPPASRPVTWATSETKGATS